MLGLTLAKRLTPYFAVRFAGWLVDNLLIFGIPLLCYQASGELSWSGLALALQWTPRILSLMGAGFVVDRLAIRQMFLLCDSVRLATGVLSLLLVTWWPQSTLAVVLAFGAVAGVFFEQTFVAGEKAGRLLATPAEQPAVQSTLTGLEQVTIVAAPALGGLLLLGPAQAFIGAATACYAVSLLLGRTMPAERAGLDRRASLKQGLTRTLTDPVLRPVILLTMGLNYMLGLINGSAAGLTHTRYGASETTLSFVYSAASIASIAAVGLSPWLIRRFALWRYGAVTAVCSSVVCLALAGAPTMPVFALCLGAFLALDSLFSVYMRTSRAERVPAAVYGSTVAAFGLLVIVPLPLAGGTLALLGGRVDPRWLLIAAAVGALLLTLSFVPALARGPRAPEPEAEPDTVAAAVGEREGTPATGGTP
ncbi:MFS transporter [Streptomyces mashuensis]|uniref:MFS transporter n=1 Tax=Streptomyces mashuensis TaxID=33904 RepID=A0A919B3M0_9ACTN|nr:MFS transporter [Streptomyces mashuensis]GHF48525.1 MFS transporter [Streptomyces mashuensis]